MGKVAGKRSLFIQPEDIQSFGFSAWGMTFCVFGRNGYFGRIERTSGEWGEQGPIEHLILLNQFYMIEWKDDRNGILQTAPIQRDCLPKLSGAAFSWEMHTGSDMCELRVCGPNGETIANLQKELGSSADATNRASSSKARGM